MSEAVVNATHTGELSIGAITIPCAVLADGTRVLTRQGFMRAIGRTGGAMGGRKYDQQLTMPVFLNAKNLKPFIKQDLINNLQPVIFRMPEGRGRPVVIGYKAELLPQVCNVFLDAADHVSLNRQKHIVERCKILIRGLALVGITALVDEATGYQDVRDRLALQAILDKFLRKELAAWAKTFPDEFYQEMYKLRGWAWPVPHGRRTPLVGHYTNDLVYERLAPGLLNELEERNPKNEKGNRKAKHHQWLTEDVGNPALAQHLFAVMSFMRASTTWDQFYRMMQRAFPKRNTTLLLPIPDVETNTIS
jgi:hypothetical protein